MNKHVTQGELLADEYDAAQERGEVKSVGNPNYSQAEELPSASEIGLTPKEIHEAREIRDAEQAEPGIVRRALAPEKLSQGFDWSIDDSVVLKDQPATAVYYNPKGVIVIRQERGELDDDDSFIFVTPENVERLILELEHRRKELEEAR